MDENDIPQRAMVFIDGNNLYHRLKERGWKTWIDIGHLSQRIIGQRSLAGIYYYNAPPPGGKAHTGRGNEYLAQVQKTPKLTFRKAWLQPTKKADEYGPYQSYVEKGGDTALTTDLVSLAARDKFDVAIIVSNDGDYEPAARTITKEYGKSVEVIYFKGNRTFTMESCALMREFRQGFISEFAPSKRRKIRKRKPRYRKY
jgi:uncharacterized LabA/DUF88 family protein